MIIEVASHLFGSREIFLGEGIREFRRRDGDYDVDHDVDHGDLNSFSPPWSGFETASHPRSCFSDPLRCAAVKVGIRRRLPSLADENNGPIFKQPASFE